MKCIEAHHRPSTRKVYHNHWEDWKNWCSSNNVKDPVRPRSHQVANYMAYLSQSKKLSASTLKTRKAAIASVMKTAGVKDVTQSVTVSQVISGAENMQPPKDKFVPQWDIAVILNYLKGKSFRTNKELSLPALSYKTSFLIALASGRRVSEISNLSGLKEDVSHSPDGSITLKFLPDFLAKNQSPSDPSPQILIKPLNRSVDPDQEDISICPVRALNEYRRRTDSIRSPSQRALFISMKPSHSSDLSRASISRWLKSLIRSAYMALGRVGKNLPNQESRPRSVRAHEIRAWAATMASKTTPLTEVMKAAYWKTSTVFIRHYLRDVSRRSECGKQRLPAMVAAQSVVGARH